MGVRDALALIYEQSDIAVKECLALSAKNGHGPPTCKRGCTNCCYLIVTASFPEICDVVYEAQQSGHDFEPVRERITTQFERIRDPKMTTGNWLDEQHRCPMLKDNGDCAGYARRPFSCRAYHVFNGPDRCGPPQSQTVKAPDTRPAFRYYAEQMSKMCGALSLPFAYGPMPYLLPLCIAFVNGNPDERREVYQVMERDGVFDDMKWATRWLHLESCDDRVAIP